MTKAQADKIIELLERIEVRLATWTYPMYIQPWQPYVMPEPYKITWRPTTVGNSTTGGPGL